jgi:GNAT superfamily N-acetyltransferase
LREIFLTKEMTPTTEWQLNEYTISTERSRLDLSLIHDYLSNTSYWASGRTLALVQHSIENSLCFGLYKTSADTRAQHIGFARVVTDYATFAWLADVFVLKEYRAQGLAKWLIEVIVAHPELQGFRRWLLATRDAHELYRRFGFSELDDPGRWMERFDPSPTEPG